MFKKIILLTIWMYFGSEGYEGHQRYEEATNPPEVLNFNVTANYKCERSSYFSTTSIKTIHIPLPPNTYSCNHTTVQINRVYAINGSIGGNRNSESRGKWNGKGITPLNITNVGIMTAIDKRGNIEFVAIGQVSGGPCDGDRVLRQANEKATRGSCKKGLTQTDSGPKGSTFIIQGQCASNCVGRLTQDWNPGLTY